MRAGTAADRPDLLLSVFLDAELPGKRAWLRFETGGHVRLDSVPGADARKSVQRRDAALSDRAGLGAEQGPQNDYARSLVGHAGAVLCRNAGDLARVGRAGAGWRDVRARGL